MLRECNFWTVLAVSLAVLILARHSVSAELSVQDKDDIARVETYLNGVRTLAANFIQVAPSGAISRGQFYLKRPGRLRFEYEPPASVLVVADGTYVNYFDVELGQLSQIGVYSTPLGVVVAQQVKLEGQNCGDIGGPRGGGCLAHNYRYRGTGKRNADTDIQRPPPGASEMGNNRFARSPDNHCS